MKLSSMFVAGQGLQGWHWLVLDASACRFELCPWHMCYMAEASKWIMLRHVTCSYSTANTHQQEWCFGLKSCAGGLGNCLTTSYRAGKAEMPTCCCPVCQTPQAYLHASPTSINDAWRPFSPGCPLPHSSVLLDTPEVAPSGCPIRRKHHTFTVHKDMVALKVMVHPWTVANC
jgi:hypothetical protein